MFLTHTELAELTEYAEGSTSRIIKWLHRNGYPFELSAQGRPKVLRAYVMNRLGVTSNEAKRTAPDFSHWEK
jgi:hypothetical protein